MSDTKNADGGGGARRYGCVLFDDVDNPKLGWAAVNGNESYVVNGLHDLANDVTWLTNLNYDQFKTSKASVNPSLRSEAYLPMPIKEMLAEWGLDPANTSLAVTAKFCSSLFQRIMGIAWKLVREANPDADRLRTFVGSSLREDLRGLIPRMDAPEEEAWHLFEGNQAVQDFTATTLKSVRGAKQFKFRRPRLAHAFDLFTAPVPSGEFKMFSRSDMRGTGDRVSWVRSEERPCMVNATVLGLSNGAASADVSDVFAFGNSINKERRVRTWMPHPEFMVLSTFARVDVLGAWVGETYRPMNLSMPQAVKDFLSNRYVEMSWSAGVVAECLLRAALMPAPPERGAKYDKNAPQKPRTTWQGAWLRSVDRMSMFTNAMEMYRDGFVVQSYGLGWVKCAATDDQVPDLMNKAMSLGMVPTFWEIPDALFKPGSIPWSADKRSVALAGMTASKQKNMLWNLDRLPMYERERQEEMLRQIAGQGARKE